MRTHRRPALGAGASLECSSSPNSAETPPNTNFVNSLPHNLEKLETRLPLFCAELHIDAQRQEHEMPSAASFFLEAARAMKPGAGLLLAEPAGHVSEEEFQEEITAARAHGISVIDRPPVKGCVAALMRKP